MNEIVNINGKAVARLMYRDLPVVTLGMVDDLHERPQGTAKAAYRRNQSKFLEGEDYFNVPFEEWKQALVGRQTSHQTSKTRGGHTGNMIFLTETGYLMLVKVFDDDLSWQIQRQLVKSYFARKALVTQGPGNMPMTMKINCDIFALARRRTRN